MRWKSINTTSRVPTLDPAKSLSWTQASPRGLDCLWPIYNMAALYISVRRAYIPHTFPLHRPLFENIYGQQFLLTRLRVGKPYFPYEARPCLDHG